MLMNGQRPSGGDGAERDYNKKEAISDEVIGQLKVYLLHCGLLLDEAAEVVQQTFVKYPEHGPAAGPEPIEKIKGWFFRTAKRLIVDRFRERKRHPMESLDALPMEPKDERRERRADREEVKQRVEWFRRWLEDQDHSSIGYRLLCGRYFEKRRVGELAESLGLTYRAAVNRLSRLRAEIHEWIVQHMTDDREPS
jgi:RNA polymerase sigma factor (sigma-70 family)